MTAEISGKGGTMKNRGILLLAALISLSLIVSGCVALVAGAAAGAGGYAWAKGKLTFTTAHGITEAHSAVISAFQDSGVKLITDETSALSGRLKGIMNSQDSVAVDLEPLSSNVTKIDVRVGFWGNRYEETKIADAIQRHLR